MKRARGPDKGIFKKVCAGSENGTSTGNDNGSELREPLQVFCRIRPLLVYNEVSCVKVILPNKIIVKSPEINRDGCHKEIEYTFKKVFDENTSQSDVFMNSAFDLVKNLIEGKNGLMFAYGITGSGKSFTMNGSCDNAGIMPRCLDVLFNSIHKYQTKKFVFKPDKMNGFDVQSESDAMLERQKECISVIKTPSKFRDKRVELETINKGAASGLSVPRSMTSSSSRSSCDMKVQNIVEDNSYAVFVTYIEIYNNSVYDLMEDIPGDDFARQRPLQPKLVREDGSRNMYVHGVTEVEVKSSQEAFDVYFKGQKRRRLACTALNSESSRSHSVFTIRLVQAPLDMQGDSILMDRKKLNISQLSLVDLAGSERTSRTKTAGQRLREAASINNSLLTLRTCLEILRENQFQGCNKMVPYRESRLTHLFKSYFDGEGDVRMIICVNPRAEDYDETLHVLKFSEMSQEVQIMRPTPMKLDPGLTPGRRKANQVFKQAISKIEAEGIPDASKHLPLDIGHIYRVGPHFPDMQWTDLHNTKLTSDLKSIIKLRMERSNDLNEETEKKVEGIRQNVVLIERAYFSIQEEMKKFTESQSRDRNKNSCLEKRVSDMNKKNDELQMKLISSENVIKTLQNEILEKEKLLTHEHQMELARERNRLRQKAAKEEEKLTKKMEQKFKKHQTAMEFQMREKDQKLKRVHRAINTPSSCSGFSQPISVNTKTNYIPSSRSNSECSTPSEIGMRKPLRQMQVPQSTVTPNSVESVLDLATTGTSRDSRRPNTAAVLDGKRHRRSRSAGGGDFWLDHRPITSIAPPDTVMQPIMKRRKSVTLLTDSKDIVNSKTSKYCLTTQAVDSDGDFTTCLYKGDVVPTYGGGAQVLFNDVEILHHKSPHTSPSKMNQNKVMVDSVSTPRSVVEDRCAVSLEGHSRKSNN